jgi:hypothetical protein
VVQLWILFFNQLKTESCIRLIVDFSDALALNWFKQPQANNQNKNNIAEQASISSKSVLVQF